MKTLKIFGIGIGTIAAIGIIGLVILGSFVPETFIYYGRQVPKKYVREIRDLGLLSKEDRIKYFYTDAFIDIKNGMYFVTDSKLVLYCNDWEEPETLIDFEEITKLEVEFDDSFISDSIVYIETTSGFEMTFPLSSEKGRDKAFVSYLEQKSKALRETQN